MKILHLYPDLMNLYGEYANVLVLKKHLLDQGATAEVVKVSINDDFNFNDFDFVYCGSGLESNLKVVLNDLLRRKESLISAINNNIPMLFTGNSMELFGEKIDNEQALNILPFLSKSVNKRLTGDVVLHNDIFGDVVGFINTNTIIDYKDENALFKIVFKDNNLNISSKVEGYRLNKLYVTHLIGPLLVKNPNIIKYFVKELLEKDNIQFKEIDYKYELESYITTLSELKGRIN